MNARRILSRRQLLMGGAAAAAAAIGVPVYSVFVEPHWVELVRRQMPLGNLPAELNGIPSHAAAPPKMRCASCRPRCLP